MSKTFRHDTVPFSHEFSDPLLPSLGIWIGRPLVLSTTLVDVLSDVVTDPDAPLYLCEVPGSRYIPPTFSVTQDVGSRLTPDTSTDDIKQLALERAPHTYPVLKNINTSIGGLGVLYAVFDRRTGQGSVDGTYGPNDLQLRITGKAVRQLCDEKFYLKKALGTALSTHGRTPTGHEWLHVNLGSVPYDVPRYKKRELLSELNKQLARSPDISLGPVQPLHIVLPKEAGV